jgi:opacity protein-like surface antigen
MIRTTRLALALALAAMLVLAASAAAKPQRLPKGWAKKNHVSQAARDADGDGLSNWGEWRSGTNPRKRDTDHDGVRDGAEDRDRDGLRNADEVALGADPRKRDSDHDGVRDGGEEYDVAGRVASVAGSAVTLRLDGGASVTAKLTDDSVVGCGDEAGADDPGADDEDPVADASQVEEDGGDDTGADEDPVDDAAPSDDAPVAGPCTLATGDEVEGVVSAGPGGLTVAELDVV